MEVEPFWDICAGVSAMDGIAEAALCKDGESISFREYGKDQADIFEMVSWLSCYGCQIAVAKGDPDFLLELVSAFEKALIIPVVASAEQLGDCPSNIKEANWMAKLLSEGSLNPPLTEDMHRCARGLARHRRSAVESAQAWSDDLQEFLEGQNIRFGEFFPDISVKPVRSLIELALSGKKFTVRDVAELCPPEQVKAKEIIWRMLKKPFSVTARRCVAGALRGMEISAQILEYSTFELEKIVPAYAEFARGNLTLVS
ncbi:MAG: hypothetical protein LBC41_00435 [Clostridiales bacterium]|nr:hypothetical protein [Clostridiales bacterium]MDR2749099.1 hypothetical protein [Clostridiales bacterium]